MHTPEHVCMSHLSMQAWLVACKRTAAAGACLLAAPSDTCCCTKTTKESTHHVALVRLHCNTALFNELHHVALMEQLQHKRQRLWTANWQTT